MSEKNLICIGRILSTHGLIGNVKLESFCENVTDIFNYELFDKNYNKMSCKKVAKTNKYNVFIVKFENINSIEEAEKYRNFEIFTKKDNLEEINDNQVYINDLIGMVVNGDNKTGIVNDVYNYGAGDSIEILWDDNKKLESIPFTKDFIKKIDKENKILYIDLPKYI